MMHLSMEDIFTSLQNLSASFRSELNGVWLRRRIQAVAVQNQPGSVCQRNTIYLKVDDVSAHRYADC